MSIFCIYLLGGERTSTLDNINDIGDGEDEDDDVILPSGASEAIRIRTTNERENNGSRR